MANSTDGSLLHRAPASGGLPRDLRLWSLIDAMEMGLPVLIIRNRSIDIDVEHKDLRQTAPTLPAEDLMKTLRRSCAQPSAARAMGPRSLLRARARNNS